MDSFQVELLKRFFREMVTISAVETTLLRLFSRGVLRGTVHTCLGQEAIAVGVCLALDRERDVVCSNHRGHGHYLAFGGNPYQLIAELMGHASGVCKGIGGSQHIHFGNFYSNGILGGMAPIATGIALAEKVKKTGAVSVQFLGDGAMAEGVVSESFNMAALWSLPVLFVVESNGFAQSTPTQLEHAGALCTRGDSFGIPVTRVDGNDVMAVYTAASSAVKEFRAGAGPKILFMETYRLGPHSKGDDLRSTDEIASRAARAPIPRTKALLDYDWCCEVESKIDDEIAAIVASLQ